jgi:predicted N-acetyltransferase YhbS
MSGTAAQDQDAQDALSYELLLTKFSGEQKGAVNKGLSSQSSFGDASTIAPEASSPLACDEEEPPAADSVAPFQLRGEQVPLELRLAFPGAELVAVPMFSRRLQRKGSTTNKRPVTPGFAKQDTIVLHNVTVNGSSLESGLQGLRDGVRALSEAAFGEDCLKDITKKSKWQLSLLANSSQDTLYGFIVTKVTSGCLSIAKLAVSEELRGRGLGRYFMDEVMKAAKKRGDVYEVCLSARATAERFYQRLGFKADRDVKLKVDFEVEEGQVYMEKKLRQRPRRQK